jgi:hypothetical protein
VNLKHCRGHGDENSEGAEEWAAVTAAAKWLKECDVEKERLEEMDEGSSCTQEMLPQAMENTYQQLLMQEMEDTYVNIL